MARVDTGSRDGHVHKYTDKISGKRATRTTIAEGHDHPVIRDDAGRVLRIGRAGDPAHSHPIK